MNTVLTDMAGAYIEHSDVITAFTSIVYSQLKDSVCRVYPDNVQYKWTVDGEEKTVIPDATINCRVQAKKGNAFFDIPRFVMEVLSDSTKSYDRGEKMEIYTKMEIDEYWIVDWEKDRSKYTIWIMTRMAIPNTIFLKPLQKTIKKSWRSFISRI